MFPGPHVPKILGSHGPMFRVLCSQVPIMSSRAGGHRTLREPICRTEESRTLGIKDPSMFPLCTVYIRGTLGPWGHKKINPSTPLKRLSLPYLPGALRPGPVHRLPGRQTLLPGGGPGLGSRRLRGGPGETRGKTGRQATLNHSSRFTTPKSEFLKIKQKWDPPWPITSII